MKIWAMVPARGGSKSIPTKNLVRLNGRPLLEFGVRAAQATHRFSRIVCSTDSPEIARVAQDLGIEVDMRPDRLAEDDSPISEVAREFLSRQGEPDLLALIQPTSPFVLPCHIEQLLDAMIGDPEAKSGQTLSLIPHNQHSLNQRILQGGRARFLFPEERAGAYNKQRKPKQYSFGNLVIIRPRALQEPLGFFSDPSVGLEIEKPYDFDLDNAWDLKVAEALLASGLVRLPHLG